MVELLKLKPQPRMHSCHPFTSHYKNTHVIYRFSYVLKIENFQLKDFDIFLIFAPKHRLVAYIQERQVLTSTHNLCFGAKIRKLGIHLHTPVLLYKSGVQGGIHYTDMFS